MIRLNLEPRTGYSSTDNNGSANGNGHSGIKRFFSRVLSVCGLTGRLNGSNGHNKIDDNERERQRFTESVRSRYNLSEDKLAKLLEVVDNQYSLANGLQTREQILQEEANYSREYREFQEFLKVHGDNSIGRIIVDRVNSLYRENQGKKSVARIFRELKASERFSIGFRYNKRLNRYEIGTDNNAKDIRDLPDHGLKRTLAFICQGTSYRAYCDGKNRRAEELDWQTVYQVKRDIMLGFHKCATRDVSELRQFGFNINYKGVDSVIEERYDIINPYASSRKVQRRTRPLEPVGV